MGVNLNQRLRQWARRLKSSLVMLWFCSRHPDTPLAARMLAVLVVAYAFSPIDLVPDFIPVLGYVDDVLLVPLGIWLALRLVPATVKADCRVRAEAWQAAQGERPRNLWAGAIIVLTWALLAWLGWRWWSAR
ncbi:YkvA family protein [Cupriavidus pinatubonensis]|uniref:DUF1232 domain-containing protein n=1 Tax=Cupriavidus pinatubonensis TaxID=248026 RepID=A0ABM8XCT4_9BURK|nr:YkvA family protein [Cupriavidus pinatubonensis]CAG9177911.1 hypothetical protein LMG23994_03757 [Cupriavidus pinatubonensis]